MYRLIKGVVVYAAVIAATITSSWSFYTSDVDVVGNTMKMGSLYMTVNDEEVDLIPVIVENMKPGDVVEKTINLRNSGTIDINNIELNALNIDDSSGALSSIRTEIVHMKAVNPFEPPRVEPLEVSVDGISRLLDISLLKDVSNQEEVPELHTNMEPFDCIKPGEGSVVKLKFIVPKDMELSQHQGANCCFDLRFSASQF